MDDTLAARAINGVQHFDPDVHPEIAYRLALMGYGKDTIAAAVGVSGAIFDEWCVEHPELEQALRGVDEADSHVYYEVLRQALGRDPVTGVTTGEKPSLRAMQMWLKMRKVWRDEPPKPVGGPRTLPELLSLLRDWETRLSRDPLNKSGAPTAPEMPPASKLQVDAGF